MRYSVVCVIATLWFALTVDGSSRADTPVSPASNVVDPLAVQHYGPAYRYPQAGWIVVHIEGEPYERGYQHGKLLSQEIVAFLKCSANQANAKDPQAGWSSLRTLSNALFLRRYEQEYLEEMKGIAEGASADGARFEGRALDLVDIVTLNAWAELETLDSALEATPTGLEGKTFPKPGVKNMPAPKPMHCSAFAATGPATRDGKVVIGHITMFGLYQSYYYNIWLDVKPTKGHRVLMQTYPGGIQSGMDYYLNDAGLVVLETTIGQTRFDIKGMALASRIRHALQYADSIDKASEILIQSNNGLYTNEWLMADTKTNEIAMLELGTSKTRLSRSSRNEWFGNTPGFYWGCNNTKDRSVRLDTIASLRERPFNVVFAPSDRDKTWVRLYNEHKGKIDAEFGMLAFTTPPLAAYHSLDAKVTTTDLMKDLKTWALFGPPLGRTWQPTYEERTAHADIKPLVSNPWTILHGSKPGSASTELAAADLKVNRGGDGGDEDGPSGADDEERPSNNTPAWHGTFFPKTPADIWLTASFVQYERYVAQEKSLLPSPARLGLSLSSHRANYTFGTIAGGDFALADTKVQFAQNDWYRVVAAKGLLMMNELRQQMGRRSFEKMMDSFGLENAGKEVTTAQFQAHVEKHAGKSYKPLFQYWLHQTGLPSLKFGDLKITRNGSATVVDGQILVEHAAPGMQIPVIFETKTGEAVRNFAVTGSTAKIHYESRDPLRRVVIDKYGLTPRANGWGFTVYSFHNELPKTLIVYGTLDETPTNREAAEALQKAILARGSNIFVPIRADKEVTEEEMKNHHLVLIGLPDTNKLIDPLRPNLPIKFGPRSLVVEKQTYAHPGTAIAAATRNPLNPRYSVVVLAGLSAEATVSLPSRFFQLGGAASEVAIMANGVGNRTLIVPTPELVREINGKNEITGQGVPRTSGGD